MQACPLPTPLPTDSILRRHFEQLAATAGLPPPPQDSVLLRHYLQLLDARLDQRPPATAPARPADKGASAAKASAAPRPTVAAEAPPVMRSQAAHARHEAASIPDRNPPPATPTSWLSRLLARIFGN